ncbi:hypothetical protein GIB67_026197 [Kingdonia uniflora]|uniref:WD repeat-containing protein 44 n=1 Tax=Kingdonia uniflora TaxID=39325 RepID=A0A7J7LU31_9MAGN|nr:hypothetical protein GIB67_033379 [Kingdonia uniflora]KAF6175058.1 hypothetical protein GIB67_026197 [Kingdonia uniflora]
MGSYSSEDDEFDQFYDTRDEITSVSDLGSDGLDNLESSCRDEHVSVSSRFGYDVWVKKPESVDERRDRFLKWMGIRQDHEEHDGWLSNGASLEIDRITDNSGAVLGNSDLEDRVWSSRSSSMSCLSNFARNSSEDDIVDESLNYRIKNLDDGTEFIVDEYGQDGMLSKLREVGSNRVVTFEEFDRILGLSPMFKQFMVREAGVVSNSVEFTKRMRRGWLRKLGAVACVVDRQGDDDDFTGEVRAQKVRVHARRKRSKEFSALYMGQDIRAHEGSILTMKFSPDGHYLASAGGDGIVRVWQVLEHDRSNEVESNILDIDHSCTYFKVNSSSEVSPLMPDKERTGKSKSMRNTSDSTCVILPPKVFRVSEKPLHEFHGHTGEVLDLSWSKNKYLLSSSVDKTVRLWKLGCDKCVSVFSHNNYVTCVQFNPVDDNYFISGSIDGKVRIWVVPGCKVIDWIDIKEIVTAICYRPDGQGGILGSMTGNCFFYDAPDNHLELGAQVYLSGKKKSPGKRIIGFQFSSDSSKVMVTSADSQVRILDGLDVICKYRGLKNAGSQISASFTSDGKHIVSASEDSNVYVWNYNSQNGPTSSLAKNVWSSEHFFSSNVSVAIPWCGFSSESSAGLHPSDQVLGTPLSGTPLSGTPLFSTPLGCSPEIGWHVNLEDKSLNQRPLPSRDCFSLSHQLFSEILPKVSATWPEENLPTSKTLTVPATICKLQYKFLKTSCQSTITSPHVWGLAIVTAGLDGHIRTFQNYGLPVHT